MSETDVARLQELGFRMVCGYFCWWWYSDNGRAFQKRDDLRWWANTFVVGDSPTLGPFATAVEAAEALVKESAVEVRGGERCES